MNPVPSSSLANAIATAPSSGGGGGGGGGAVEDNDAFPITFIVHNGGGGGPGHDVNGWGEGAMHRGR